MSNSTLKIRNSFLLYVFLILVGFTSLFLGYERVAFPLIILGSIVAVYSAFITCPYCNKLNGVFFKILVGGVFPIGKCLHCRKSFFKNENEK